MLLEKEGWRVRSRKKSHPADFRTGTANLVEAKRRAKEWLAAHGSAAASSRKGGGSLEKLAKIYEKMPKRTQGRVGKNNVGRLRAICRTVFKRELEDVTCLEITPKFWQEYQRSALENPEPPSKSAPARKPLEFNLVTRYRENIAINAAVRAARCLFLPAMLRAYRAEGLSVHDDAGKAVMLPVPYVPPSAVDDDALCAHIRALLNSNHYMWLTLSLARFAGLRREEIARARTGWIEIRDGAVSISLRDRPEEEWWTKTGKPYRAQVIDGRIASHLAARKADDIKGQQMIVPDPYGYKRAWWFKFVPQDWLKDHGFTTKGKPLHRLRGLYADELARVTADAVTARLAGVQAAQTNLGHTSANTTLAHYLTDPASKPATP